MQIQDILPDLLQEKDSLRQAALSGTYAAPDATGKIVRQSGRQVPADAIDKINKGFGAKPDAKSSSCTLNYKIKTI